MSRAETEPQAPDPDFPRFSQRRLPPYRYVHGLNPHPRLDVDGHSYGAPEPWAQHEIGMLLAGEWPACEQYLYGVDLYNHAYWWEAHEAWEAVWMHAEEDSPLRHLLQCLIQVSAAHFQKHAGIVNGVQRLLERAKLHCHQSNSAPVTGFHLLSWWEDSVIVYFSERDIETSNPSRHVVGPYPFLNLK